MFPIEHVSPAPKKSRSRPRDRTNSVAALSFGSGTSSTMRLASLTPEQVQMLDGSCARLPLTVINHIGQTLQIRFYPFYRSVIDAERLLRQKESVIHAARWGCLGWRERLP